MHLLVIANLAAKNNDLAFNQVKEQIDRVYGDEDIPQCLEQRPEAAILFGPGAHRAASYSRHGTRSRKSL